MKHSHSLLFHSLVLSLTLFSALSSDAASLSLSGNARLGTNMFNNADLSSGTWAGVGNTSSYVETRFLVRPDVFIDDHFTLRTEWMTFPATGANNLPPFFGTQLGNGLSFGATRAYLEWVSDWGIFSIGRMPKHWGLGVFYNGGNDVYDSFATLRDRASFRALLGNLALTLAYEKLAEGMLTLSQDDADAYELSIEYSNAESLFDVGLLYTRSVIMTAAPTTTIPSQSAHLLSIYSRKKWSSTQLGGELLHQSGKGYSVLGAVGQLDYMPSAWNFGFDFGYVSGSTKTTFSLHPNYHPFMILFNQSVGPQQSASTIRGGSTGDAAVGRAVANGTGTGAVLSKINISYGFDQNNLRFGWDLGHAALAQKGNNAGSSLGVESDFHFMQKWYENFSTTYSLGLLFPGSAFGKSAQVAWGLQIRGALVF